MRWLFTGFGRAYILHLLFCVSNFTVIKRSYSLLRWYYNPKSVECQEKSFVDTRIYFAISTKKDLTIKVYRGKIPVMSKHKKKKMPFCGSEKWFLRLVEKLHIPPSKIEGARQEFAVANIFHQNVEKALKKWLYLNKKDYNNRNYVLH